MPFREPLDPAVVEFSVDSTGIRRWLDGSEPFTVYVRSAASGAGPVLDPIRSAVENSKRGMFVVGGLLERETADQIVALAEKWGWPILADITSQTRLGSKSDLVVEAPHFIAKHGSRSAPDVVIRFGSHISSKTITGLLKTWPLNLLAAISDDPRRHDAEHAVSHKVHLHPSQFCSATGSWQTHQDEGWLTEWTGHDIAGSLDILTKDTSEVSEPGVARRITQMIPADQILYVASSMPVRDFDLFADGSGTPVWVGANRGASGIDGTIASAVGAAASSGRAATIVAGDLALLHDLNSLSVLTNRSDVVVVFNNDGGGIFSFLPIAEHPNVFELLFGTQHGLSFEAAASLFGLRYDRPETIAAFSKAYLEASSARGSTLIEIVTNRKENRDLHRRLDDRMAALF